MAVIESLIPQFEFLFGDDDEGITNRLLTAYGGGLDIRRARRTVTMNFVETVDGVLAYPDIPGTSTAAVSMKSAADRFLMGLLRASADAVLIGAATMRADSRHQWTPAAMVPAELRDELAAFRRERTGRDGPASLVVLSASGNLPAEHPALQAPATNVLVITSEQGARALPPMHPDVQVATVGGAAGVPAATVVDTIESELGARTILCEGGPTLFGDLAAARLVDELFLTLAPQLAGRSAGADRPALIEGVAFAPGERPLTLRSLRRHGDHLFLRYEFAEHA